MDKIIQLTMMDGNAIWIHSRHIVQMNEKDGHANILMSSGRYVPVKESPFDICIAIRGYNTPTDIKRKEKMRDGK